VTSQQALAMAKKYLTSDRLIVIAVGDRAKIERSLRQLNLGALEIRDTEGRPAAAPGRAKPAA
jgi:hypothetical protein